jgi:hypothetical protein
MHSVSQLHRSLTFALLACVARALAADAAAPAFAPVARSAQIALTAARGPSGLTLQLRRTSGEAPLLVTGLSASIDGASVPVEPRADGSWWVQWPATGALRGGKLEVTVAHDGINEILTGALPLSAADGAAPGGGASGGVLHGHTQLAWWILNIAVVLVAVIAISRRMS